MKKICLLIVLCLFLSVCSAFAEETAEAVALIEQAQAALETEDYETAVPLLQKAADQGDATGQLWLGNCYLAGLGIQQDSKEAVKYYQLAADQGNAPSCYHLGLCFKNGWGTEQDDQKAAEYFLSAADQGLDAAQYELGVLYQLGRGVEQDDDKAFHYYSLAAEQEYPEALTAVGYFYGQGLGTEQNLDEMVKYYNKAVELGEPMAQFNLGCCYRDGTGVEQDYEKMLEYFRLAVVQGNANAQFNLGFAYYVGQGVDPDYGEAFRLYQLAADQGFPVAMFAVGDCYYLGNGVEKDPDAAKEWYQKSLDAGYEPDETDQAHMKEVFGEVSETGKSEKEPFRYIHDPQQNPNAMQDIIENPAAVYGFSPDPNSTRLGNYADYDWTDPVFVAEAKKNREEYHASMESMMDIVYKMRDEGATMETIAREVSAERNRVRLAASENDPEELAKVRESNLKTYGNEEGPTPDQLYEKYGSWQTVLQKAFSPNLGMDAVCGLYDDYYDLYVELGLAPG